MKELYDGRKFVIVSNKGKFFDKGSNEEVSYQEAFYGGIWSCEINMLTESFDDYRRYDDVKRETQHMYYILRDSLGNVITSNARGNFLSETDGVDIRNVYFVRQFENKSFYNSYSNRQTRTFFMLIEDYNSEIARIKKDNDRIVAKEKVDFAKGNLEKTNRINILKEKYGSEIAQLISIGKIKLGMNIEMCDLAWYRVYTVISRTQDSSGNFEIWKNMLYGTKLYFKNKKVIKIVD